MMIDGDDENDDESNDESNDENDDERVMMKMVIRTICALILRGNKKFDRCKFVRNLEILDLKKWVEKNSIPIKSMFFFFFFPKG